MPPTAQTILLAIIVLLALTLPLLWRKAEENLEAFLLICGLAAAVISSIWSAQLLEHALREPLRICAAVFVVGLIFKRYHFMARRLLHFSVGKIGLRFTLFFIVFILGMSSSIITAIVAALILSEVAAELCLQPQERLKLVIYTCFAISIGSVLTPIGEPLGTIIVAKLKGPPHNAGLMFLIKLLWPYILSAIIFLSFLAYRIVGAESVRTCPQQNAFHSLKDVLIRTLKVYIFVAALIFLGEGLKPLAYQTIYRLPPQFLYWVNILSATLDNATLATIEVVPQMSVKTLRYLIVSLILGGGMMIPANIPNVVAASKLGIGSRQWARAAVPLGLGMMAVYFAVLLISA